MPVDRPGQPPPARALGGKPEEPPIICGVAYQDETAVQPRRGSGGEGVSHQPVTEPAALTFRRDRDRADHHQRHGRAAIGREPDWPALDRADQSAVLERGEAERRQRGRIPAYLVGSTSPTLRLECAVEQRVDGGGRDPGKGNDLDQ